jgi:hypothetical protein
MVFFVFVIDHFVSNKAATNLQGIVPEFLEVTWEPFGRTFVPVGKQDDNYYCSVLCFWNIIVFLKTEMVTGFLNGQNIKRPKPTIPVDIIHMFLLHFADTFKKLSGIEKIV